MVSEDRTYALVLQGKHFPKMSSILPKSLIYAERNLMFHVYFQGLWGKRAEDCCSLLFLSSLVISAHCQLHLCFSFPQALAFAFSDLLFPVHSWFFSAAPQQMCPLYEWGSVTQRFRFADSCRLIWLHWPCPPRESFPLFFSKITTLVCPHQPPMQETVITIQSPLLTYSEHTGLI